MNGTTSRQLKMGICALAAAGLFAAAQGCSSSSNGNGGAGGTTGGTGGKAATGGSTGAGGTVADAGPPCTIVTAPAISDFEADGGTSLSVGISAPYLFAAAGLTSPTVSLTDGKLVATINTGVPAAATDTYAGFGLPFNACANVAGFTGVKFNITGTLSAGCGIQFSLVDQEHSSSVPFGTCTGTCYPGAKIFTLPATATDVTVLFSEIAAGGPATPILTPSKAIGIQWQINVPAAGDASGCSGTVTVDNVAFVQ
ncbi:MAG TPA: hypothetical protein VFH68_09115 [Polyangia bacterium]|nr:hypothetical protein [Polyangia bacterium]